MINVLDNAILSEEYNPYLKTFNEYYIKFKENCQVCRITKFEDLPKSLQDIVSDFFEWNKTEEAKLGKTFGGVGTCHYTSQMMYYNKNIKLFEGYIFDLKGNQIHHSWNKIGSFYIDLTQENNSTNGMLIGFEVNNDEFKYMVESKLTFLLPPINWYVGTDGKIRTKQEHLIFHDIE